MRIPNFVFVVLSVPCVVQAQQPAVSRSIAFFGRVEAVDVVKKVVLVKHGKIPGYLDSGTTEHPTEEPAMLNRLRPGDDIRATVYANDLTLRHIQIVYRRSEANGKASK